MSIDEKTNDLSCLYAAKNFAPHLRLEQPKQLQQETQFIKKWQEK